jgi:hypothetical protein
MELALAILNLLWALSAIASNYVFGAAIVNSWTGWNLPTLLEIRWK